MGDGDNDGGRVGFHHQGVCVFDVLRCTSWELEVKSQAVGFNPGGERPVRAPRQGRGRRAWFGGPPPLGLDFGVKDPDVPVDVGARQSPR